jgi:hypothetical protein
VNSVLTPERLKFSGGYLKDIVAEMLDTNFTQMIFMSEN